MFGNHAHVLQASAFALSARQHGGTVAEMLRRDADGAARHAAVAVSAARS